MAKQPASFWKSPEFLGAGIGGLGGAVKGMFIDQPAYEADVASRAIEARFAPLQNRPSPSFSDIKRPSAFQTAMDYGLTGLAMGQNVRKAREDRARFGRAEARADKLLELLASQNKQPAPQVSPTARFSLEGEPFQDVPRMSSAEGPILDFGSYRR
jgi:hypothetical protein